MKKKVSKDKTRKPQIGIAYKKMKEQEDLAQIILNLVAAFQKKIKKSGNKLKLIVL